MIIGGSKLYVAFTENVSQKGVPITQRIKARRTSRNRTANQRRRRHRRLLKHRKSSQIVGHRLNLSNFFLSHSLLVPSFLAALSNFDAAVGEASVAPLTSKEKSTRLHGPEAGEGLQASVDLRIVAQTITTYPLWPGIAL